MEELQLLERTPSTPVVIGRIEPGFERILTPAALRFLVDLEREFRDERCRLLLRRIRVQRKLDLGWRPDFRPETEAIRMSDWNVGPLPKDLLDRRVEITGPTDRKMVINALNCGANVFMADFEDALTPSWENLVEGQNNLFDAVRGSISYDDPVSGKHYRLNANPAVLMVRPRGWHLPETHVLVDGEPISGSLFDFGLFLFHNWRALIDKGTGPYFYLPKLESAEEARLWNDVFLFAERRFSLPIGTIKATVLIETILAAFEMDEILYALKDHAAGLNCGRWDYIYSFIKKFRNDPRAIFPDRAEVGMTTHFLESYVRLLIKTCHRRGAHAMGGMAAQIPIRNDPAANASAMEKVRADKEREVREGHDGTWVAHPGLVSLAKAVFDRAMPAPNQISRRRDDATVTAADLLTVPKGRITQAGLRHNIAVGLGYIESWLRGAGCVPLYNLMEDAATAEICRSQVWQWRRYGAALADGRRVDSALCRALVGEVLAELKRGATAARRYDEAATLFQELIEAEEFVEFLTLGAYEMLTDRRIPLRDLAAD